MLTVEQELAFRQQGFLALSDVFSPSAIAEVRRLIDPLFEHISDLPARIVRDIASGTPGLERDGPRTPEISRVLSVEPRLARTEVFRTCKRLAAQLTGRSAWYCFDHAIYKQPFNHSDTPWHQDQAYTGHRASLHTLHFWTPLQDVDERNGCMNFIPGSHEEGLRAHHRRDHQPEAHALMVDLVDTAKAVCCPLRVGGLTIHTPFTLHYSGPNDTAEVRRAWILHFGPYGRMGKLRPNLLFDRLVSRWSGRKR
jgi:hypothetical protein